MAVPLRILVVGSLCVSSDDTPVGGTSVSLRCLIDELRQRTDVQVSLLDLGCPRHTVRLFSDIGRVMRFLCRAPALIRNADVATLHLCSPSSLGLPGLLLARLFRKPLVIRKFGGNDYRAARAYCWPWLADFVLRRTDLYLAQTHQLVDQARRRGISHARWFPTHRPVGSSVEQRTEKTGCHRFVYVGQVREHKGMRELASAAERLAGSATVDVYGPLFDDLPADLFLNRRRIFYRGVLDHHDVVPTLHRYDAFVLPTKAVSEGYPGAILEAYAAGLPIVATRCGAIPELVDSDTGLLVAPGDVDALHHAMTRLSTEPSLYGRLRTGACARADAFSASRWAEDFVSSCRHLAARNARRSQHLPTGSCP